MAKKAPSPAQLAARQRFADAARKRAAEAKANKETPIPSMEPNEDLNSLRRQVEELKQRLDQGFQLQPQAPQQPQMTAKGIVGSFVKYPLEPKYYPDPRERLSDEQRLAPHAFKNNFELEWEVSKVSYETKDGQHIVEPKFRLYLNRIVLDEQGDPTNQRYTVCKATFFEDPDAAITEAHEQGLDVPEELHKSFLDEMRYLRMRDWLLEAFYPPKPSQKRMNKRETVIGNRLVEVFEINSQESATIPFGQITKKG